MFFEGKLSSEKSVEVTDCPLSQQVTFNVAEKLDRLLVFWGGTTDSNGFMLEHWLYTDMWECLTHFPLTLSTSLSLSVCVSLFSCWKRIDDVNYVIPANQQMERKTE